MRLITVNLPEPMLERLDKAVELDLGASRAEILRLAARDWLVEHDLWKAPEPYEPERIPEPQEGVRGCQRSIGKAQESIADAWALYNEVTAGDCGLQIREIEIKGFLRGVKRGKTLDVPLWKIVEGHCLEHR